MTPIDLESIDNYPNSIFLGSWCNHFKATKKFKNIKPLEYHWADRKSLIMITGIYMILSKDCCPKFQITLINFIP